MANHLTEEGIFRCADMMLVQFYFASEIARDVTFKLGDRGGVHFLDLNKDVNSFQRAFVSELKRINATSQDLDYLRKHTKIYHDINPPTLLNNGADPSHTEIEALAQDISNRKSRVETLVKSLTELKLQKSHLIERREILQNANKYFKDPMNTERAVRQSLEVTQRAPLLFEQEMMEAGMANFEGPTIQLSNLGDLGLDYIIGSIETSKAGKLHQILARQLRGNVFFEDRPLPNAVTEFSQTGEEREVMKSGFILYTHGSTLLTRARKIIDAMGGVIINVVSDPTVYDDEVIITNEKVSDLEKVVSSIEDSLRAELNVVSLQLDDWRIIFRRELQIYQTLNMFAKSEHGNQLIAEGWIPASDLTKVKLDLRTDESTSAVIVREIVTNKTPPTFHRTNKFTQAFQAIVDAYGVASYQEVNPGLATIVTFPFMFAIMFGDLGHGLIVFLIALYLVVNERKLARVKKDEISAMAYDGRYILLLMGIFSMYTGFLYNDLFSKSMTIFPSGWKWPEEFKEGETVEATKIGTYLFGLDFAWHGAENNLIFTNSYKMKLSILMGYVHMSYSFMFSLVNYRFRKSDIDIKGNFLPGLIFMQSIFGYLSFTIIYKWCNDWSDKPAPGLLNMLINMFLSPGKVDDALYPGQAVVQILLLIAAVCCVPVLLIYKPWKLKALNEAAAMEGRESVKHGEYLDLCKAYEPQSLTDANGRVYAPYSDSEHERYSQVLTQFEEPKPFEFGDVMIHQVIHTIEFCLNCVSHTASYLRLWALSLAHAQLSTVLWSMTIANAFSSSYSNVYLQAAQVFVLFALWFVLTVCILVLMEGTSAMLHSLRLHWVEAMSKFFEGEGYAYTPFTLIRVDEDLEDDEES